MIQQRLSTVSAPVVNESKYTREYNDSAASLAVPLRDDGRIPRDKRRYDWSGIR
jgi:hypothetical protein